MEFNLPRLTTDIDCEPIGYPGLRVTFWLNPPRVDYDPPEYGEPWESVYWWGLGRILERLTVPAEYSGDGAEQVIEIPDGQAVYELVDAPGFDWQIVVWATAQYRQQRQERLRSETKN